MIKCNKSPNKKFKADTRSSRVRFNSLLCGRPHWGASEGVKVKKFCIVFCIFLGIATFAIAEAPFSEPTQSTDVRYRLFPTQNMWTFLKLDTMTGKIWQVQFSVKDEDYRFETVLSSVDITETLKQEKKIGRFTLYPTQNTYNFVMLDQLDGYIYQVQWSGDWENRFVLPIPN